jgi:hypothetical protein
MTLKHAFLGVLAAGSLALGCNVDHSSGSDPVGYYFTGVVYDGLTGETVTSYSISLQQASGITAGTVDKTGAYEIGPLKPGSDYTVTIKYVPTKKSDPKSYRPFFAVESGKTALPGTDDDQLTKYYEAYLFPKDLVAPKATLELYDTHNTTSRPSGEVRFVPAAQGTSALNLSGINAAAVTGQVWFNDADLKADPIAPIAFTDGVVNLDAGKLVYGVAYNVTVYAISGVAYNTFSYTAGSSGLTNIDLTYANTAALNLIGRSPVAGLYSDAGTVTFTFNEPIQFSDATPDTVAAELLDDAITIYAPDTNANLTVNQLISLLVNDNPTVSERGTSIKIADNTLTISWPGWKDPAHYEPNSFDEQDLQSVTYDLTGISIRRAGATDTDAKALSTLVGATDVTVPLHAPSGG